MPHRVSRAASTRGAPASQDSQYTSTGAAAGLVAGHQAPAPQTCTQQRCLLTCHPAQPACMCRQALQILIGLDQDSLVAEPANRSGIQLGAGGRQADPAGRGQGGRSRPRRQGPARRRGAPRPHLSPKSSLSAIRRCVSSGRPRMPIAGRRSRPGWVIAPCSLLQPSCNLGGVWGRLGVQLGPGRRGIGDV